MKDNWISVKDCLPEFHTQVLIHWISTGICKNHIEVGTRVYIGFESNWHWSNFHIGDKCVTHWMPLPEFPKKELAKNQSCGCVICTCEDEIQCQGCGAKNCGTHQVGKFDNPKYKD